ncbi:cache domain-containing sensor histidine kinase [Cohnella hashimotonis]|uniref:histidine kinase n=1 Tax=Cohnella hashimotonis TaxID=2826895 RepID=A0ABT6TR28_9BACL|nr:sensor histidine kinase [Cohnella hashimotonis]MDI4648683.1 sensor histidine kinase [Cohnella hashimotonis]
MRKRFQSIHGRLFLIFLFSMLGLLLIVSLVYYQRATEQIRDKVGVIAKKNISQTVGLFELMLKGYDSVTKSLNSNNELMQLLQQKTPAGSPEVSSVNRERQITDILGAIFYSRSDIVGIHVISSQGKVYSFDRSIGSSTRDYKMTDWYAELQKSKGDMRWLGVYPQAPMSGGIDSPVFAFGRQLFELSTMKSVGYVLIETEEDPILSALSNASIGPGSSVVIRDSAGNVIVRTRPEVDGSEAEALPADWPGALKKSEVAVRDRKDALLTAARIGTADWTVIGVTPKRDLKLELKQTQRFLLTVVILLVAAATALATLVSRSFSSPFKRLIQQMKQVELGNFQGRVRVHSYQELNVLVGSFNRMVQQMDNLIEREKLLSISEKNAQLQALQSQVNPHFLFNTLDMIYWLLDERENDRLGRLILALSRIFRYSSDWEEASRAPLRLELEQLRHYLTIIETRLGGRVNTEIEVEERWLGAQVPKMILQPIVENAVKYGLEPLSREGVLRICSEETEDALVIVVEDNGVGMDEETLLRIRQSLEDAAAAPARQEDAAGRRGIGLANVHRRIALMYGEGFGLRIESECERGTKIMVSFPKPAEEGDS